MRYSRLLTVLALVGVVGLAAALVPRSAHPVRAATGFRPTLRSTLNQELQQLVATPPLSRKLTPLNVQPAPGTCFVAGGCSENPCVVFVQSRQPSANPVSSGVQSLIIAQPVGPVTMGARRVIPSQPGGLGSQACTHHGRPPTLRVSGP
ncbi:MAG: hypothetical protein JO244_01125 [Solirubrobacterales bacterium]|nr:hypothetical protein [Solirubrobacterales bacterium]